MTTFFGPSSSIPQSPQPSPSSTPISAFHLLFSAIINHSLSTPDPDLYLHNLGEQVSIRSFDYIYLPIRGIRRESKLFNLLQFITTYTWKWFFTKTAELSQSEEEFIIEDRNLILNKFISPGTGDDNLLNCGGAFASGIVEGVLKRSGVKYQGSVYSLFKNEDKIDQDWSATLLVIKK